MAHNLPGNVGPVTLTNQSDNHRLRRSGVLGEKRRTVLQFRLLHALNVSESQCASLSANLPRPSQRPFFRWPADLLVTRRSGLARPHQPREHRSTRLPHSLHSNLKRIIQPPLASAPRGLKSQCPSRQCLPRSWKRASGRHRAAVIWRPMASPTPTERPRTWTVPTSPAPRTRRSYKRRL